MQCDDCIYSTDDNVCICEDVIFDIEDECLSKIDTETYNRIYNKAIDDYTRKIELKYLGVHYDELYDKYYPREIVKDTKIIAEQLKAGGNNA